MAEPFHQHRDTRLDEALSLLAPPVRKPVSAAGPLLAATLLACAGAALVYLLTLPPEKAVSQSESTPAQPAFELSGSSAVPQDTPPVRDAVVEKDEALR